MEGVQQKSGVPTSPKRLKIENVFSGGHCMEHEIIDLCKDDLLVADHREVGFRNFLGLFEELHPASLTNTVIQEAIMKLVQKEGCFQTKTFETGYHEIFQALSQVQQKRVMRFRSDPALDLSHVFRRDFEAVKKMETATEIQTDEPQAGTSLGINVLACAANYMDGADKTDKSKNNELVDYVPAVIKPLFSIDQWRRIYHEADVKKVDLTTASILEWKAILTNSKINMKTNFCQVIHDFVRYAVPNILEVFPEELNPLGKTKPRPVIKFKKFNRLAAIAIMRWLPTWNFELDVTILNMTLNQNTLCDQVTVDTWIEQFVNAVKSKDANYFLATETEFQEVFQRAIDGLY